MRRLNYLVTGTTDKTGVYTVRNLLKGRDTVRAFVHQKDECSEALKQEGADIFEVTFWSMRKSSRQWTGFRVPICVFWYARDISRP